jgi:hypothetical protein
MEGDVLLAELHRSHYLIGLPVEVVRDRAAAGAPDTLIAEGDVLAELVEDLVGQFGADR